MHWIALQPLPHDAVDQADTLASQLTALGWQALHYTPKVAQFSLSADLGEALVMEVSASERLFGGRRALLGAMFKPPGPFFKTRQAREATALAALAKLQLKVEAALPEPTYARLQKGMQVRWDLGLPPARSATVETIDQLPLHTLAAARPHLGTLAHVGCNNWGALRALPRGGVVRRFGADLLDALDRAYGVKPEIYPWLALPDVFEAQLELQAQVNSAPALLFGARRLLNQLQLWLQLRSAGVLSMEFGWTMDARRNCATQGALVVGTAEPTQDIAHLQRLLGENLAKVTLPAPVLYLSLRTLQTEKLVGKSASLLLEDIQKGDSLHQMVERVSARLGTACVLQLKRHADHRPEQMQAWVPAFDLPKLLAPNSIKPAAGSPITPLKPLRRVTASDSPLYPTWLLTQPMPLVMQHNVVHHRGPLTLLSQPYRLETGWWGEVMGDGKGILRDYYMARNQHAGLVWIYRDRMGKRTGGGELVYGWYLHGVFG